MALINSSVWQVSYKKTVGVKHIGHMHCGQREHKCQKKYKLQVYKDWTFQLVTAPLRCFARVLLLLLMTMTPLCSVLGSSPAPSEILYSCK